MTNEQSNAADDVASLVQQMGRFLAARAAGVIADPALEPAWRRFHELYGRTIRNFVRRNGVASSDVDDVVQQVWVAVFETLPNLKFDLRRAHFRSWLYVLIRNTAVDHLRRAKCRRTESLEPLKHDTSDAAAPEPLIAMVRMWREEMVRAVLEQLGQSCSEVSYRVFWLRRMERRSIREVAEQLGLTIDQVCERQHRLDEKFRQCWDVYTRFDFGFEP